MTNHNSDQSLYSYPRYYDLVYGSDWKAEYDFLLRCFDDFAGRKVKRVFEPACGTGRLLYRLAKAGFRVGGLDLNERAVRYCNDRLKRHGVDDRVEMGDMSAFQLTKPVDAAFNMINSFRHLLSEKAARGHLQCVADALATGGLYVLGIHLTPTESVPATSESWSARRGHLCVNSSLHLIECDWRKRVERYSMTFDVYTPSRSFQLHDEVRFRTYTRQQFERLLKQVPALKVLETYDFTYDLDDPIVPDGETEDIVYILRKR